MIKNFLKSYALSLVMVLGLTTLGFAQTSPSTKDFPNVKIKNFGQMDERFYRGAQPEQGDYQALKDLGITTVIDLREDPEEYRKSGGRGSRNEVLQRPDERLEISERQRC